MSKVRLFASAQRRNLGCQRRLDARRSATKPGESCTRRAGTLNALKPWHMATANHETARRSKAARPTPELRAAKARPARPTTLTRLEQNAKPFLVGAGVGASVAAAVVLLTSKKRPPAFTLFPEPKSQVFASVAKIALIALGRTLFRRALTHAAEKVATQP